MSEYASNLIEWTKLKARLHLSVEREIYFREREIWWASLGLNVGREQNGKHEGFERPVLVLRKFGGDVLWILPFSSKTQSKRFTQAVYHNGKTQTVLLSQLRLISKRRLIRKAGKLPRAEFEAIIDQLKHLI